MGFTYSCLCASSTDAEDLDVFIPDAPAVAPTPAEGLLVVAMPDLKEGSDIKLLLVKDAAASDGQ